MIKRQVAISILNWNNFSDTIACVASIEKYVSKDLITIIITDNCSTDNSYIEIKKACSGYCILQTNENLGYASGHKFAYDYAKENFVFDYFWVLNNDLQLFNDALKPLIKASESNINSIFGSVVIDRENEKTITWGGTREMTSFTKLPGDFPIIDIGKNYDYAYASQENRWVIVLNGCSIFLPVHIIEKYGFISDDFFLYHEETDYCLYLYQNKIKSIVVSASVVVHDTSYSTIKYPELHPLVNYYKTRNLRILLSRRYKKKRYQFLKEDLSSKHFWELLFSAFLDRLMIVKSAHYFQLLGIIHHYLGKKGKTFDPNNFISL